LIKIELRIKIIIYKMSVLKQMSINQLLLPDELLDIIKSYAFMDKITHTAKIRKNIIHALIQNSHWTSRLLCYNNNNYYMFMIEQDINYKQYQMWFCCKCGNYKTFYSPRYDKIECKC